MSANTAVTTQSDKLFNARDLCKEALSRLMPIAQEQRLLWLTCRDNLTIKERLADIQCTCDTIDVAVRALENNDLSDGQAYVIMCKAIRQAKIMLGCLRHEFPINDTHVRLGSIRELMRDALGTLSL